MMTIYMWITIVAMLLAVVIANTDKHIKLQFWTAVLLYMILTGVTVSWWLGV